MPRILRPFEYFEPGTVEEVVQTLSKYGTRARVLAGGCYLVPNMRLRQVQPECVVSIGNIPGLDYVDGDGAGGLKIGAMTKIRSVEVYPEVQKNFIALYEALHSIVSIQVKATGTFVGNICVATPDSNILPALLVFGAQLKVAGTGTGKVVPIDNFCVGVRRTSLQPDEIVTEVLLPAPTAGTGSAFLRLARTAMDIPKISVAVMLTVSGGTCSEAKIALGSVAPTPIRAAKAEGMLKGQKLDTKTIEAAGEAASDEISPITNIRSTAEYRKDVTKVLVRRAVEKALERAQK